MAWEENRKHLLGLSYHELQYLCKQYNLPANKSHYQLASSLAFFLAKDINAAPERKTQTSLLASPLLLSNVKEASTRCQDKHKRGPSSDIDVGGDKPILHVKHHKGPQTPMDETLKTDSGTRVKFTPVPIKNRKTDCFSHSPSVQGIASSVQSQIAGGIGENSPTQGHAIQLDSTVMAPNVGENNTDNGSGSSDKISENKHESFHFSVMSDDGIDLFVDLNCTPSTLIQSMKEQVFIIPSNYHSEPGNFSHSISSLVTKDDSSNCISSPGDITVGIQNKGAVSIPPFTKSSLCSTGGGNSHSEPYLPDVAPVNSMSSASTFPGGSLEISGSQEGAPVYSSSLTSDIQNISHMTANALNNKVLPQDSVDFSICPERNHAPLDDASVHAAGNVVRSDSDENSYPSSKEKYEMINVLNGAQLAHNGGQTLAKFPVTDAQSEASCADRFIAGSFKRANTTPSPAASDNAFSSKHGAEPAQSHDSAYKNKCDLDGLEELESKTPPSAKPPRNIVLSLRSASARQIKPATLPRRSARLVPK
ncbi:hypothetical protein GUJ93_ZPchr0002g26581 [Zizania palustris]|nr:hypothetical protein GUJ93_ZPchr0002g26581 [Zizania palustris]